MKKYELNDKELRQVIGSKLDDDARNWINNNYDALAQAAGKYLGIAQTVLNNMEKSNTTYTLKDVKDIIRSFGIDPDNL